MENTRITFIKQVTLSVLAFCVLACSPIVAHADSTGTGSINVVPGNGGPRGIRLRSQTVDLAIKEDGSGVWADTDLRVQLHNRGDAQVIMPIEIPGPQISETEMPEISEATLGGRPLALTPAAAPDGIQIRSTATITIPVRGSVDIRIRYRQALAVQNALASYAYLLTAGNVWAGAPESLRVSITFAQPIQPEQLLHLAPAPHSPNPGTFTWEWGGVKAPSNIGLAFMSSEWWRQLDEERAVAAMPEAGLREHAALGERYWYLATLAPPAFAPRASFYERFHSQAIAEWRAGITTAKSQTDPVELAKARERLAGIYLAEGNREGGAAGEAYLQLALGELEKAAILDPEDADLQASSIAMRRLLMKAAARQEAERNGSVVEPVHQELASVTAARDRAARPQAEGILLAQRAIEAGDFAGASRILAGTFGPDVLELPSGRPPRISQALLFVDNAPGIRTVRLQMMDYEQGAAAAAVISEAAEALHDFSDVAASGTEITLTLRYDDPVVLLASQDRLNAALADLPELGLLSSALFTRDLAWPVTESVLTRTHSYRESVDLRTSTLAWEAEAAQLDKVAGEAEATGGSLNLLRAAIWRHDAQAWRGIGTRSRAVYQAEVSGKDEGPDWMLERVHRLHPEGISKRQWVVRAGELRQLGASALAWRYDRLVLLLGAMLMLALMVVLGAWAFSRAPAGARAAGAAETAAP